jgi:RHS repeat-associated protein
MTDPRGNTTNFVYDALHRLVATQDPAGTVSTINYDNNGNVIQKVDRLGRSTNIAYDALNRIQTESFADAVVTHSYDAVGKPVRLDDSASGPIAWIYDNAGRLTSETTSGGTVQYSYNTAGQRASIEVTSRPPVTYTYDSAGRLQTITQGKDVFTFDYDLLSRRISLQRPNGVPTTYSYDPSGRLLQIAHGQNGSIETLSYTYSPDSQIISTGSLAAAPLLPDSVNIPAADPNNRITQFGSDTLSFDDAGEVISRNTTAGITQYHWDARGRLIEVDLPSGQVVTYGYDALRRRISKTINGITTNFIYNTKDIVLETTSAGSVIDYLNGPGIDEQLSQTNSTSSPLYFLQDSLNSIIAITDVTGVVVERPHYGPFGSDPGNSLTRYGYTGRENDSETGLYYYRARYYDPLTSRFMSEDPAGPDSAQNFYAYVNDDPIDFIDPTGMEGCKQTSPWHEIPRMYGPDGPKPYRVVDEGIYWTFVRSEDIEIGWGNDDVAIACLCTWASSHSKRRKFYREEIEEEAWFTCENCGKTTREIRHRTTVREWEKDELGMPFMPGMERETLGRPTDDGCLCFPPS